MTIEDFSMSRCLVVVAVLAGVACTKPNPRSCADGTCTDPAYPFCDVDGALEGHPDTCIAVSCTPGDVAACRGDVALTCNAEGTTYDEVQCTRGCDVTIAGGCRVCEPNQTVCANGAVQSCDANGNVTSSESCPLGCFEDQPRCREIDPSNNLGMYLDMVQSPPDLDLTSAEVATDTGIISVLGHPVTVPSFLVPPSGNGAAIRVFVVKTLKLASATVGTPVGSNQSVKPALAFVARGDITIRGELVVTTQIGGAVLGCRPAGSGGWLALVAAGGGGGGNATAGADGGAITSGMTGGTGDTTSGTSIVVPLRGGCSGGDPGQTTPSEPNGGGAIQLVSGTKVDIDATIDVRGADGTYWDDPFDQSGPFACSGGGAGGSILLEAPIVRLGDSTKLLAGGGNGFTVCPGTNCGAAGMGATASSAATKGGDVPNVTGASAGGGGGGLGRVRINTRTGVYDKSSSAVEDALVTAGMVSTR